MDELLDVLDFIEGENYEEEDDEGISESLEVLSVYQDR